MDKINLDVVVARGEMDRNRIFKLTFFSSEMHNFESTEKVSRKKWILRMVNLNSRI